jgi:PAS domain S-box-containing protein
MSSEITRDQDRSDLRLESLPIGVLHCTSRRVLYANRAARVLLRIRKKKTPLSLDEFFNSKDLPVLRTLLRMQDDHAQSIMLGGKRISVTVRHMKSKPQRAEVYITEIAGDSHTLHNGPDPALFKNIIDNSEEGVSIVRSEKFLFVNKKFSDMFGFTSPEELIGNPITDVIHSKDMNRVISVSKGRQRGRNMPFRYEFTGKRKDGKTVEIDVVASRITYNGKSANLSFHRDITERKLLEQQLVSSEAFRKSVFSSVNQGIVVFDTQLRCIDWNTQMHHFTGVSSASAIGKPINTLFSPFYDQSIIGKFNNVLKGAKASLGYLPYQHPHTKQIRFAWLHISPLLSDTGTVHGGVGVLSDLTQQKYMQDEIKESESLFRNVLEVMGDALVLTDLQGKVLRVNREFERITGYEEQEAIGQTIPYTWFYEEDTSRFVLWISELREKNYLHDFDIRWKRRDNLIIPVSLNTTLLRNKSGEPIAMLNIARDITDRKKLETEIRERTAQIELINRIISKGNESIDIYDLLKETEKELRQFIRFDLFGVILIKGDIQFDEFKFSYSGDGEAGVAKRTSGTATLLGANPMLWKKPVFIQDLRKPPVAYADLPLVATEYRSLTIVPIFSKKILLGVLYIARHSAQSARENEISNLQPICEQIGLIVDKLNLFTRVRDDAQYIHNLLDSMDSIVFTVNNELIVTESNTPIDQFPFYSSRGSKSRKRPLIGLPLYKVISGAPYRMGIEQVVSALFSQNISIYTTEFSHTVGNQTKSYHLRITPLKIVGRIVGLVFNHTDITNLKTTEDELKRRNRDLIEVNELSAMLAKSLSVNEVYEITLNKILQMFGAHIISVYLIEKNKIILSGYAGTLNRKEINSVRTIPLSQSITRQLLHGENPIAIKSDLRDDPRISAEWRPLVEKYKLNAVVSVPLVVQKKILGSINLNFRHPRELTPQELQLLLLITNQLSAAIDNIRLYSNLHARVNDLTLLASLGNIYASSLDIKEIADNVIDKIKKLRNPDVVSILLFDPSEHTLKLIASQGVDGRAKGYTYTLAESEYLQLIEQSHDVIIDDVLQERPEIHKLLLRKDQQSMGIFILQTERNILGILSVGFAEKIEFLPEDIALYRNIATQVSMAIQNALLYQQIQDSEEKYRLLVETAHDMVISMDMDGTFTYVSPSSVTLTGYNPSEIIGKRFNESSIHSEDYMNIDHLIRLVASHKMSQDPVKELEFRVRTKSGEYRWVSASWTLAHQAQGEVAGIQCILRDVHARRLAEEERNQQLQRLRVLYELAQELAATLDQREIFTAVFEKVKKVIPFDKFYICLHDFNDPDNLKRIFSVHRGSPGPIDEIQTQSIPLSSDDAELERHVLVERHLFERPGTISVKRKAVAPMITKERVLGLMIIEDSERGYYSEVHKNLLQTIAHLTGIAIEKAMLYQETVDKSIEIQLRNRELDDFTYVVSHDLKEPLISIEGYGKILVDDYRSVLTEDGSELLTSIRQSSTRMKNLINELLTLSRVGRITESMTAVPLEGVLNEILEDFEFSLRDKNARILIENPLPVVLGNRVHLLILLRNLISNGIKFNKSDSPTVRINSLEESGMYEFSVSDNGIGIPREYFDKIFIIFQRLWYEKEFDGTGAGLTIVKKIVETHGGRIWLDSKIGEGTTFYFTLRKPE